MWVNSWSAKSCSSAELQSAKRTVQLSPGWSRPVFGRRNPGWLANWTRSAVRQGTLTLFLFATFAAAQTQHFDIALTYYTGPSLTDPGKVEKALSGPETDNFVRELQSDDADKYCLSHTRIETTIGLWEKSVEPSFWIESDGRLPDALAYAAEHSKEHHQRAFIIFVLDPGGTGMKYIFPKKSADKPTAILAAVEKAGLPGAAVAEEDIYILDPDGSLKQKVQQLVGIMHTRVRFERGQVRQVSEQEYDKILKDSEENPPTCNQPAEPKSGAMQGD